MGWFSAWAPNLLRELCTQFPWLNLLFLLSKVLKPVPTQLAVDMQMGSKGHFLGSLLGGRLQRRVPHSPLRDPRLSWLRLCLCPTNAPGCLALCAHPGTPLPPSAFSAAPGRGSGPHCI